MFKKVLIAEDMDFINSGIKTQLANLSIPEVDYVQYCDEALLKLKRAEMDGAPFDLLISDLSFDDDAREQTITSGDDLIKEVRALFSNLKIIVFSVEDKAYRIQNLYKEQKINGYVWKGRDGLRELKQAIQKIENSDIFYISPKISGAISNHNTVEISDYDIFLIESLSKGFLQGEISEMLKKKKWTPSSVSAVEKRLKFLKEHLNVQTPAHLVAVSKDLGLI